MGACICTQGTGERISNEDMGARNCTQGTGECISNEDMGVRICTQGTGERISISTVGSEKLKTRWSVFKGFEQLQGESHRAKRQPREIENGWSSSNTLGVDKSVSIKGPMGRDLSEYYLNRRNRIRLILTDTFKKAAQS